MKKILGFLFFYSVLGALLLPLMITLLCNGFGKSFPQEATGFSAFLVQSV